MMKKFMQDAKAVSPVVATLMLVLVAAGAAVGLGVFLGAFQDNAQDSLGNTSVSGDCVSIGGSTTVHPFTVIGTGLFEAQNPGICFDLSQGGSTLGLKGVGTCALDIGARSKVTTTSELETYPDCDGSAGKDIGQNLVQTKLGDDGVIPIVSSSNCLNTGASAGQVGLLQDELRDIYGANGGKSGYALAAITDTDADTTISWDELEAHLDARDSATYGFGCGSEEIVVYDRADKGGTSEVFCNSLLGDKKGANVGFCDSESQATTGNLPNMIEKEGNAAVESAVEGDANALGFSSIGTADAAGLTLLGFDNADATYANNLVDGTLDYEEEIVDGNYDGARSLFYVTVGEPSGIVAAYLEFILTPQTNAAINDEIGYIPLY